MGNDDAPATPVFATDHAGPGFGDRRSRGQAQRGRTVRRRPGLPDIGVYGGPVETPALDALAGNGVRFTDFHSGSGVCSPSRAVAMTGRHHIRAGVYHVINDRSHDMHLLEREVTLAELLKPHGYATAHVGKWHLGTPFHGRDKPRPMGVLPKRRTVKRQLPCERGRSTRADDLNS